MKSGGVKNLLPGAPLVSGNRPQAMKGHKKMRTVFVNEFIQLIADQLLFLLTCLPVFTIVTTSYQNCIRDFCPGPEGLLQYGSDNHAQERCP